MTILEGCIADPETTSLLLTKRWQERWGRDPDKPARPGEDPQGPVKIHPDAFRTIPQGDRILVVVDPVPERWGLIYIPDETVSREQMGIATVIGAGHSVGKGTPYPGGVICDEPGDLLYKTIITAQYIGIPIRFDPTHGSSYHGSVFVIGGRDVLGLFVEKEDQ